VPSLPSIVIVGRPNVGKSTLFNAILGQRRSIVGDEPGITRDRIGGEGSHRGKKFELIDTGGIIQNDNEMIPTQILKQARVALQDASHVIFLLDGRAEITGADRDLAAMLRRLGKPVVLAINKIDVQKRESLTHEFHALGFPHLFPVSAEHRMGLTELLDHVTEGIEPEVPPASPEAEAEEATALAQAKDATIKVAIIGRPNVGKSTLLNALLGEERAIVSPIAGTTRDAVDETIQRGDTAFTFVDTAGIRRKGKTKLMAEKLSVVMARRHLRMSNVALLVIDASEGMLALDATIAGYAHEEGRPLVIVVNKWDASKERSKKKFAEDVRDHLKFLDYAPLAFVSAKHGRGIDELFKLAQSGYQASMKRISTGELNRFIASLEWGYDMKIYYMTQASLRPPTFIVFTDKAGKLHFSAERYLINRLRERFDFAGTPIEIKTKRR
jgi:GTP-binding protein